jgi:hypothetical protein
VLSNPYTPIGKTISAEATVKGLRKNGTLKLEFWVETPSGKNEQQAKIDIKDLPVGAEARYTTEFTPTETGFYTIYAYLYDGYAGAGYKTETIYETCNPSRLKFPAPSFAEGTGAIQLSEEAEIQS